MVAPSIIHAHHKDRVGPAVLQRKGYCYRKWPFPQANSDRVSGHHGLSAIPNGACIEEYLKRAVPIFDGIVQHPVSAQRIQLIFVPAAQSITVAERETLVK